MGINQSYLFRLRRSAIVGEMVSRGLPVAGHHISETPVVRRPDIRVRVRIDLTADQSTAVPLQLMEPVPPQPHR